MSRSSVSNDEILNNNIDDLIYKFDNKTDRYRLQQLLSKPIPHLNRDLQMFYDREQNRGIMNDETVVQRELLRRLILNQNTDSLLSLNDSEICSKDQSRMDSDGVDGGHGRERFYQRNLDNDDIMVGKEQVAYSLSRFGRLLDMLSRLPWPKMSFTALGICFLGAIFISPRACVQNILFPAFRLVFGTLYPAYASYKAVRTKNVKEYVKWMMYWIVYAFFTCIETFTDIFLAWFPFYYEVKVLVVLWLLSPATKGSSVLYRKFVHPMLTRREQEIDDYLNQAKERGYTAVIQLGSKGVNYATNVIMQTALKGGGNLVQTIRRSYSLSDLSEPDVHRTQDEIDQITRPHQQSRILRQRNPNPVTRSSSGSRHSTGMYFSEIDVTPKGPIDNLNYNIRSSEDISSGYSSAEPVSGGLSRTSSMTSANKLRFRAKRAEGDNFSENDENEYLRKNSLSSEYSVKNDLKNSPTPPPVTAYPIISNISDSPLIRPIPRTLTKDIDWKDEIILENEDNFQNSSTSNIDKEINVPPEMNEKYEMFCQWLENNKKINNEDSVLGKRIIKKQFSDDDFKDTISVNSDEGLENFIDIDSSNDKIEDKKNNVEKIEETKEHLNNFTVSSINTAIQTENASNMKMPHESLDIIKTDELQVKNNEFLDKNTVLSYENLMDIKNKKLQETENKAFKFEPFAKVIVENASNMQMPHENQDIKTAELEVKNNETENKPVKFEPFAKVIVENKSLDDNELQNKSKPKLSSLRKDHNYEEIKFVNSSLSELKRPVYHSKGKAPIPPTPLSPQTLSSPPSIISPKILPSQPNSLSISLSATLIHESESPVTKSRSPSPKPEATKIKPTKKSLFRSYLPSIFRSESPKPIQTKPDDDYHRETEI